MKTLDYNPSPIEVSFAKALIELQPEIDKRLDRNQIIKIENKISADNPMIKFFLLDEDGDPHEVVVKIIQTPDTF